MNSTLPRHYHAKAALQRILLPLRRLPGVDSYYKRCISHDYPQGEGFYSQFGQDRFMADVIFPGKKDGVFLDIGAYDGVSFSNTYFLEKNRNWTGLCIEPQPDTFERLRAQRSCICVNGCAGTSNGSVAFFQIQGDDEYGMWSGIEASFTPEHRERIAELLQHASDRVQKCDLPCFDLNEMLQKHELFHIDYVSLDIEGGEFELLSHLDFNRFDIGALTIEHGHSDPRIIDLMKARNYELVAILNLDGVYVKKHRAVS